MSKALIRLNDCASMYAITMMKGAHTWEVDVGLIDVHEIVTL